MRCSLSKQIKLGTSIEMEHNLGRKMARKIALDHIREHPCYYRELIKMEKRLTGR